MPFIGNLFPLLRENIKYLVNDAEQLVEFQSDPTLKLILMALLILFFMCMCGSEGAEIACHQNMSCLHYELLFKALMDFKRTLIGIILQLPRLYLYNFFKIIDEFEIIYIYMYSNKCMYHYNSVLLNLEKCCNLYIYLLILPSARAERNSVKAKLFRNKFSYKSLLHSNKLIHFNHDSSYLPLMLN